MSTTQGGAHRATVDVDEEQSERRRLFEAALAEAERDARELLRQCTGRRVDRIEAAARAASLSAGRLAGFATNLGVALLAVI